MLLQEQRELVVEYGRRLVSSGLTEGTFGNLSVFDRTQNLMAMSPSGMDYFRRYADVVVVLPPLHPLLPLRLPGTGAGRLRRHGDGA